MASIISSFTSIWGELITFLTGQFDSILSLFYVDGSLTFVGVMAVVMAGISMILLVFNLVRSFFPMHG